MLERERRIAALAKRQHGVVSRAQLLALGLGSSAITYRLGANRLHPLYAGVYAVGHPALSSDGNRTASVLAYGAGAVLSHSSAAIHLGLRRSAESVHHVTVAGRALKRRRGIRLHRTLALTPAETTIVDGIPVTTVPRTLLDLAESEPRRRVERTLDEAERLRRFDLTALRAVIGLNPHRVGAARLARVLDAHLAGTTVTDSELEERFLALVRVRGLPQPELNAQVGPYRADFLWRDAMVIVETDGWQSHSTRFAFEHDHRRTAWLGAADYRVIPVTWRRLEREPDVIEAELRRALAGARAA